MAWYNLGKISINKGTKTLKGEGTKWTDNKVSINAGHIVLLPGSGSVQLYEVGKVISDTEMEIKTEYTGDSLKDSTYSIITTIPSSVPDFARRLANQLKYYDDYLTFFGEWVDTDKELEFQMPDGSIKKFPPLSGFVKKTGDRMTGSLGIDSAEFKQSIEINADAEQDRTSIGNKFKDGSLAVLSFYKDKIRYAGKDIVRVGDFGVGASATSAGIAPPFPKNANEAVFSGFYSGGGTNSINYYDKYSPMWTGVRQGGDGSGTVIQYQFSADGRHLASRVRDRNSWSGWYEYASLTNTETQVFNGQVVSYNGLYSMDKANQKTYFGLLRANKGDQFGFYCSYEGSGYTLRLPKVGNSELLSDSRIYNYKNSSIDQTKAPLALQSYHDFRKHHMSINSVISYPFGVSSGLITQKTLFGGNSVDNVGLVNFRNWGDSSGHSSCFQLASIGSSTDTKLFYRTGITGSDDYINLGMKRLLDDQQIDPVDNNMLNDTRMGTGFFRQGGGAGTSDWFSGWGSGINLKYDWNNSVKIFFHGSSGVPTIATKRGKDLWWNILWGTGNTTVDSNGFIKKASPIVEIFDSGTFNTNNESEGAKVERLQEGIYHIKNVLGLHSDKSWGGEDGGFEIPVDKNKLPLIWIDYKVQKDGSILLYTYHRVNKDAPTFAQNNIEGKLDGEPIDIPKGRFVSVRVQMPEDSKFNKMLKSEQELMAKVDEESSTEYNNDTGVQEEPLIDNDIKLLEFKG